MYHYMSYFFMRTMRLLCSPLLLNSRPIKSVKHAAEILMRLRAQSGDEALSRTQMYDWSESFKKDHTVDENVRRLHLHRKHFFWGGALMVSYLLNF
jgi:hypothetical protein